MTAQHIPAPRAYIAGSVLVVDDIVKRCDTPPRGAPAAQHEAGRVEQPPQGIKP
jgi:hypothetical protein